MKQWKKAVCAAMAVAMLAGCGAGAGTSAGGQQGGGSNSVVWWTWSTEATEAFAKQIEMAQTNNPDLKVDIQYTSNTDYWAKLPVAIAGGTGPDLYQMTRPSFEMYAASNQCMDLTEYVENSPVLKEYMESLDPALQETYKFNGKLMGIPITVESTSVAYNKTMFEEMGMQDLKEIEDSWTWEDFAKIAEQMTVKDENGETVQYGAYVAAERVPTWEIFWSRGCEMFDETGETCLLDDPEISDSLQVMVDIYQAGYSPSTEVVTGTSGDDMFISGKIAMIPAGIWKMPSYKNITTFEWDVVELPFDSVSGKRLSSSNVLGLIVNPNTKNPEATIALLEELVKPESQKVFADMGIYIPALESVRDSYFESDSMPDNIVALKNTLEYLHPNTLTQYIPYSQFATMYEEALRKAYNGEMTMQESMTALAAEVNAIMDENKATFNA